MDRWTFCPARSRWLRRLVVAVGVWGASCVAWGDPPSSPGEMLQIAELNDVFFLDRLRGWAVGERGVIWQTQDGGLHWDLVDSPATCRLESIHFISESHGWITGGWIHPITHQSTGFVLRTETSGRKWTRVGTSNLPALKWAAFSDPRRGWAIGNSSASYPLGALRSDDGGHAWNSLPLTDRLSLTRAAIRSDQRLVAVDRDSTVWLLGGDGCQPASRPDTGRRRIRAVVLDGARGWLVGDGGLVLTSQDGGARWQEPRRALPEDVAGEFDWQTVAVRGPHCWIAGSPGSCVLHSTDGGQSWQLERTGQSLPLRKVWFLDERHGWAVGSLGCILATHDGGRTWQVQRRGASRAALAAMLATADGMPWELLVGAAADEGQCCVAQLMTSPREMEPRESSLEDRWREAASYAGAAADHSGWPFPVPGTELSEAPLERVTAEWDRGRFRSATQRLEERAVRQIRIWRPDVVVTEAVRPDGREPLSHLVSQVVLRAVELAGDPGVYPEQLRVGRLEPWVVKKTFTLLPPGQRGTTSLDTQRLAIHLGCSLSHYAVLSRSMMESATEVLPSSIELRLVQTHGAIEAGGRDLFSGLPAGIVGESRRALVRYGNVNLDLLGRMVQKQRDLQEVVAQGGARAAGASQLVPQLDRLADGLSPHFAGVLLHDLAQRLSQRGDHLTAAEIRQRLVQRQPDHLFAEASVLWLLKYHGSDEWQHGLAGRLPTGRAAPTRTARAEPGPSRSIARLPPTEVQLAGFQEEVEHSAVPVTASSGELARSAEWGERIRQTHPTLYQEPAVQFMLASVHRRLGNKEEAARTIHGLVNGNLPLAWLASARGEQWLAGSSGRSPRPVLECRRALAKPYLDGVLDEPLWRQAAAAELRPMDTAGVRTSPLLLAYDEQFLFFGVSCAKAPQVEYRPATGVRSHDADLAGRDRIELVLDTDRDYATCYRVAVDHRGWTRDVCCGDPSWNPVWHVAAAEDDEQWSVEVAIPWTSLAARPPERDQAWAVNLLRIVPGSSLQAWSTPATPRMPLEGCGYLIFR